MSNVIHTRLQCPEVKGLIDKYTGRELEVFAHISEGVVTYSAPGAFSLRVPQTSVDALMRRASMRGGIAGAVGPGAALKCAYTGADLAVRQNDKGLYYLEGGFDPTVACMSLGEFVEKASCGERKVEKAPEARASVEIPDMTPNDDDAAHKVVDEETEKAAHEMAKVVPGAMKGRVVTGWEGDAKKKGKAKR